MLRQGIKEKTRMAGKIENRGKRDRGAQKTKNFQESEIEISRYIEARELSDGRSSPLPEHSK